MRRSRSDERGSSIRHMTSPSYKSGGRRAASGRLADDAARGGGGGGSAAIAQNPQTEDRQDGASDDDALGPHSDPGGEEWEEEAVLFPQSTHSWLFTRPMSSSPFWFAISIATLSYFCLVLALINVFEEGEPGNPLGVPYQVDNSVRIAQYLAIVISLIMEEEIPTGLYLLRMISREALRAEFPEMQYWRFVASGIVRLGMGYLFLFNTFCVVAQATGVLDIFYDVLALQFLQQLDDIAFNLAKIDVFGIHLKRAALSKCFSAEFEKQPFAMGSLPFVLRKHMNLLLKGVFVLNLGLLLIGMGLITWLQNDGAFYANEITVSFGEQIWSDAQVMTPSGEVESRNLLFSYFNGVYRRDGTSSGGTPIYVEQNKYDGSPYEITKGAEIRYCKKEKVWAFTHVNIRKNRNSVDLECPWLLRSPETTEFNLLDVTGDWSIWTGSIQPDGHFSTADNQCHNEVDCNYNGMCEDGECVCSDDGLGGQYFGTHCEHRKACNLISGGEGGTWAEVSLGDVETRVYQRPIYEPHQGLPSHLLHLKGVNPVEDSIRIIYTGSRWLGAAYPGAKLENQTSDDARLYMKEFHAFWENMYADRTHFVSEATSKSSIIGVDFYLLGRQGEEFGTFGELIPLGNNHKGSGHYKCVENDPPPPGPAYDINFRGVTASSNEDSTDIVVDYEVAREREYESEILARNCVNPITGIDLNLTTVKSPKNSTHDSLILKYNLDKLQLTNSNIWNATNEKIELCQLVRLIFPAANSIPKMVVVEEKHRIRVDVEEDSLF